jgi:nicotinate-nucleotide adenylyltransferase
MARLRIGIFGGTFDPPHVGHLILAAEAYDQLGLQKVLWVLTPDPPHKTDHQITPLPGRLKMLVAALGNDPVFELCRIDMDRPPPHYAIDTVRLLKYLYPTAEMIYLMGGDSLAELPTWHTPGEFVNACDGLGVMSRPGYEVDLPVLEVQLQGITAKVQCIRAPLLEISSSQLRQRIIRGQSYRYYLPEAVYLVIKEKGFYSNWLGYSQS